MIQNNSHSNAHELITIEPIQGDATARVLEVIQQAGDNSVIHFSGDCYHFWPDRAYEAYYYISNNQHGLKNIAFPLVKKRNFTIDGGGARFVFHGEIVPFVVDGSENVTLRNFSVDWERPFFSQGEVQEAHVDRVIVKIDCDAYPYRVENRRMIFEGEGWESPLTEGVFAFSPKTRAPGYRSGDSMGLGYPEFIEVESLGEGRIKLCEEFPILPELGDVVVFRHYRRRTPAVFLVESKELLLESITLHQAGGMGFIAQFCENVELRLCTVTPSEGRIFSVCADASHFVNCRGLIQLIDCHFENQLDDPLNVHGLNTRIKEVIDEYTVLVERVHHEQHGVSVGLAGDAVQFAHNTTLLSYGDNVITSVESINARYARISFERPLPKGLYPGHVVENMSWTPDLLVSGCTVRGNRARGLLISTPGKVRIEGNNISAGGSGIKISGDANFWFESGAVRDVCIRDNDFGECCYGSPSWGHSVIDIDPEIAEPEKNKACFHQNIRIENNRFATSDKGILFARSVDGLIFTGNTIQPSGFYPEWRMLQAITLEACQSVKVEENIGLEVSQELDQASETI
jgi:hypothetical protein